MNHNFKKIDKGIIFSSLFKNLFILLLFFAISFLINKINGDYLIAHGDYLQYVSYNQNINNLFLTWNESQQGFYNIFILLSPFLLFQKILHFIGLSTGIITNIIIFLFLLFSFYSFYFALKILDINFAENKRILFSLIYSLNIFTFAILTYSSGYTCYFLFYLFLPLILACFEKIISDFSKFYIAIFCIVFFISIAGFTNVAFFAGLLVLEVIILISILIDIRSLKFLKRFFLIILLQFFILSFYLFPYFLTNFINIPLISGSIQVPNSYNQLLGTSYSIFQVITMSMHPYNYPFLPEINLSMSGIDTNLILYTFQNYLKFLSFGYFIILLIALLFSDKNKIKSKIFYYSAFVLFFFLLLRLTPPFNIINKFIYKIPGFSIFRMPEKFFIFLPCIFLFFLIYLLKNSKLSKKIIYILLILLLVIPLPFYTGGISKFLTNIFNSQYSYAIKIPDEYYKIKQNIFDDKSLTRVIELPYSSNISWKIYPELLYVGHAMPGIDYSLHNKSYISADGADQPSLETKFSFKEYNDANIIDTRQFLNIIQKFSGKYIILHKDVELSYSLVDSATFKTLEQMQKEGVITKLEDNKFFNIYRLDEKYVYPMLSTQNHKIYFQKINSVKYKVIIPNLNDVTDLEFRQSFDSQWKLYINSANNNAEIKEKDYNYYKSANAYENKSFGKFFGFEDLTFLFKGSKFDKYHTIVDDYANSWKIDPEFIKSNYSDKYYKVNPDGSIRLEFTIYYKPQIYFEVGFVIVVLALIALCTCLLKKHKKMKE